jgi:hypothetical protein
MARVTRKDIVKALGMDDVQAKLFNAVLRKLSKHHLTLQDIFNSPWDYRDASAGVPGFIYYRDTVPFAKRYIEEILTLPWEYISGIRHSEYPLNDLAWVALEWAIDQVITYKEMEEQQW